MHAQAMSPRIEHSWSIPATSKSIDFGKVIHRAILQSANGKNLSLWFPSPIMELCHSRDRIIEHPIDDNLMKKFQKRNYEAGEGNGAALAYLEPMNVRPLIMGQRISQLEVQATEQNQYVITML
ncbi:hypothetical protein O6P43_001678 [Quillaja saponaria]|uniref:Uncharacterized protein n=1 Tax=Quillaja saponaria TaxID=32244 RepID=A0AAD7VP36_QUISA|nr:hypothetical protein O6P43_001678 [Quillaja saponaria]